MYESDVYNVCGSPAEMDPLFGVVLADLDGQNLRFRERLAGHRLNLRVCVCSFCFSRMRNIIMAGPSITVCTSKSA